MPDISTVPIGCTCFTLRKLARTVSRLYDQHMAATGLKSTQYSLLKSVVHQSLPVAELAARLSIERTTLTRNLKPLADAGWVELRRGVDSRQRIVTITDAGREKVMLAKRAWRGAQTQLEDTLGIEMVRVLHMYLDTALIQITPLLEDHSHVKPE